MLVKSFRVGVSDALFEGSAEVKACDKAIFACGFAGDSAALLVNESLAVSGTGGQAEAHSGH